MTKEEMVKYAWEAHCANNAYLESIGEEVDNSWEDGYRTGLDDEEEYYDAFCMQAVLDAERRVRENACKEFEKQLQYIYAKGLFHEGYEGQIKDMIMNFKTAI